MKRLTIRYENGEVGVRLYSDPSDANAIYQEVEKKQKEVMKRLAAYEDTGLMPEEITRGKMLTEWIPCSEKMPEMFCTVLVTAKMPEDKDALVHEGARIGLRWELDGVTNPEDYIILAWQPLPVPWKGEQE